MSHSRAPVIIILSSVIVILGMMLVNAKKRNTKYQEDLRFLKFRIDQLETRISVLEKINTTIGYEEMSELAKKITKDYSEGKIKLNQVDKQ